jgi:hypothetical protein
MMVKVLTIALMVLALLVCWSRDAFGQSTEFTFQGSLTDGGTQANGNYDFEFSLFDAVEGGGQTGPTLTRNAVTVASSVFTVKLDFGDQFPGAARFLEIRVRPTGQPGLTILAPRQILTSTPYAIKSLAAENANSLGGLAADQYITTTGGGTNFVQNSQTAQAGANFNIDGTGTAGKLAATTQYDLGVNRIMHLLGVEGIAVGILAGSANTSGVQNSFFGRAAGNDNTTGSYNSFFGRSSGQENTIGSDNSFFGQFSGFLNTNGNSNSFFGSNSGEQNVSGSENAFYGQSSGRVNTIGSYNAFFGRNAGLANTTGVSNTFLGAYTGMENISGESNSFVGVRAGNANTLGSNNTAMGVFADVGANNLTFASAFGSRARVDQSNSIVLGAINGVNGATSDTNIGIGTTAPTNRLHISAGGANVVIGTGGCPPFAGIGFGATLSCFNYSLFGNGTDTIVGRPNGGVIDFRMGNISQVSINSSGILSIFNLGTAGSTTLCRNDLFQIASCSSSLRYKTNIQAYSQGLDLVRKLRPITFDWKDGGAHDLGLVAEDVEAIEPLLTTTNHQGEIEGVKYDRLGVVLVNAVNEQQTVIESQQKRIETLESQVKALTTAMFAHEQGKSGK